MRYLLVLLFCLPVLAADEWPQFRGPTGQGDAGAAALPVSWGKGQNVTWRTELPGTGWSSPVISGNQVWLTTGLNKGASLHALCVDAQTGKRVHDLEVFAPQTPLKLNAKNSPASPTPVLEAGKVYVHFGAAGTACLDAATGQVRWRTQELQLDHKEGPGSSPMLYRDLLIVNCDGIDVQYIAALHKDTGKLAWKTPRSGELRADTDVRKAYSTPLVVRVDEHDELVSVGADWAYGYEPLTGKELWRVRFVGYSAAPRPVAGHGLVYLCTGFGGGHLLAVRPGGRGDVSATHIAWRCTSQVPCKPSPILVGDELYLVSDTGTVTCLDAKSGAEVWRQRVGGAHSASPLAAGGRIYLFSEEGKTTVLAAGRKFERVATSDLGEYTMATPAVSGNALFLRTAQALYRIERH